MEWWATEDAFTFSYMFCGELKCPLRKNARNLGEAVGVTGVALTKLDGSAKGGVAIPIAYELGLPVKLMGVGEQLDDLRPFDPQDFARALVSA